MFVVKSSSANGICLRDGLNITISIYTVVVFCRKCLRILHLSPLKCSVNTPLGFFNALVRFSFDRPLLGISKTLRMHSFSNNPSINEFCCYKTMYIHRTCFWQFLLRYCFFLFLICVYGVWVPDLAYMLFKLWLWAVVGMEIAVGSLYPVLFFSIFPLIHVYAILVHELSLYFLLIVGAILAALLYHLYVEKIAVRLMKLQTKQFQCLTFNW